MESFFQPILLALTGLVVSTRLMATVVATTVVNRLSQVRCEKEGKEFHLTTCGKTLYTCEEKSTAALPSPTPCPLP